MPSSHLLFLLAILDTQLYHILCKSMIRLRTVDIARWLTLQTESCFECGRWDGKSTFHTWLKWFSQLTGLLPLTIKLICSSGNWDETWAQIPELIRGKTWIYFLKGRTICWQSYQYQPMLKFLKKIPIMIWWAKLVRYDQRWLFQHDCWCVYTVCDLNVSEGGGNVARSC